MAEVSAWEQVWRINGRYLRTFFCGVLCWGCWLGYEAGSLVLGFFAAMFGAGAVFHAIIAIFQTLKAIVATLRWARFKRQGADPKADPLAERDALRQRGLL